MKSYLAIPLITSALLPVNLCSYIGHAEHQLVSRSNIIGGSCSKNPKPPSDAVCGERGTLIGPAYRAAGPQQVSLATCRDYCFNRNAPVGEPNCCLSFSHTGTDELGLCQLYAVELTTSNFQPNSSAHAKNYSLDCYECDRRCPLPDTVSNLLDNPGFEVSDTYIGPWAKTVKPVKVTMPGKNSKNAVRAMEISQCVSFCADQDYLVRADVRSSRQDSVRMTVGDGQVNLGLAPSSSNDTWTTLEFSSRIDADSDILYASFGKPGFLDNAVVKPIPKPQNAATVGPNLLENGGFETGKVTPWVITPGVGDVNVTSKIVSPGLGHEGGNYHYFFQGTGPPLGFGVRESDITFQQQTTTATRADKHYVFTVVYRLTNHFGDFFIDIGSYSWIPTPGPRNEITTFSRIFTGSGSIDNVRLYFDAETEHGTKTPFVETVELDSASIYELAE